MAALLDVEKAKTKIIAEIEKRKRLGGNAKEVDVTIATIGDSRTGKSEMAEKMEGVLSMSLI